MIINLIFKYSKRAYGCLRSNHQKAAREATVPSKLPNPSTSNRTLEAKFTLTTMTCGCWSDLQDDNMVVDSCQETSGSGWTGCRIPSARNIVSQHCSSNVKSCTRRK